VALVYQAHPESGRTALRFTVFTKKERPRRSTITNKCAWTIETTGDN
jgi:hypothetical protein